MRSRLLPGLVVAVLLSLAGTGAAQQSVEWPALSLKAVLGKRALLEIDGQQHMLRPGQSKAGIKLLEVESDRARVEYRGEVQEIGFGASVTTRFAVRDSVETRLYPDTNGMYFAVGSINGFPVRFLLDTGATFVGMDAALARRIGIRPEIDGVPETVQTASGIARVFRVTLDSVRVGDINIRNVSAHVLAEHNMGLPLLGMSFLSRLSVRNEDGSMILRQQR